MTRIVRRLLLLFLIMGASTQLKGQSVTLAWNADSDPAATGYTIYWGTVSGNYVDSEDTGTNTTVTITNLTAGTTYYFAVTAYDGVGDESSDSTEVAYTVPAGTGTTFTFASLNQTYNGAPESVAVTTIPANVPVTVTYNGSSTAPVNAGAYTVVATAQSPGSGSATNTLIISPAAATVRLSNLFATYNGSAQAVTVTTSPAGLATTTTYNGSASFPINVGSYAVLSTINNSNYTGSATTTLVITPGAATVTLSGLSAAYNGSAHAVTVTTSPAGLATTTTYNGSASAPINVGSYAVLSTINNSNYTGSASGTLVISGTNATVVLGNLAQIYTGSACPVTATTTPSGLAVNLQYNGSGSAPTNCGNYTVVGTISSTNYSGSASATLVITPAAATVTLSGLSAAYNGSAHAVTVTTSPAGLATTTTYNGSASAPINVGSYAVLSTINNSNYTGSASGTLVISGTTASVVLGNLAQIYTGSACPVTATTTPSGLAVNLQYNGSSSTPTNCGNYTVVGTISSTNYSGSASATLVITPAAATVTLSGLSAAYNGSAHAVTVTTSPAGLATTTTYNGSASAPINVGSYAVLSTINNFNYTGSASGTLVISGTNATVALGNLAQIYTGSACPVTATTTPSGLAVNLQYNGSGSAPTNCGNYTVVGTISSTNYSGSASATLVISPAAATVILSNLCATYNGSAQAVTVITSPAGLATTTTYNGSASAPINVGSYAVLSTINNSNYTGSASGTLVISGTTASVVLGNLAQIYTGSACPVTATTTPSGLAVNLQYNGSGSAPTNCGNYTVVGTIGSTNYSGSASATLVISPAAATVILSNLCATYNGSAQAVTVITSPAGLATTTTYNGSASFPINVGSYAVLSTINNSNYTGSTNGTLVISGTTASVVLGNLAQIYTGNACPVTATTTPSGLAVNLQYNGSGSAPTNCGNYTVVGTISSTSYSGSATNTLLISPATATVTLGGLNQVYDGSAEPVSSTTSPPGIALKITYNGSASAPVKVGSYTVRAMPVSANYAGGATNTLVIAKGYGTVLLGNLNQTYTGSAIVVQSSTVPAGLSVRITYNGSTKAPSRIGQYTVVGTIVNPDYTGSATNTLTISASKQDAVAMETGTAQVMLFALNQICDGTPKNVGVVTVPGGLAVTLTYNTNGPPLSAGSYTAVATIVDPDYAGAATNTLTLYDPTNALILTWPSGASNTTIYTSTNLTDWLPLGIAIGPTNQLVVPKQAGSRFYQGINLHIAAPAP